MKLQVILCTILLAAIPFAAKAGTQATASIDLAQMVRLGESYHVNQIDRVAILSDAQRPQVLAILDKEADRIALIQQGYKTNHDFNLAMQILAAVHMETAHSLQNVLSGEQFARLRPVFDARRDELLNAIGAYVNTVWYQAAVDAGYNPAL